LFPEEVQIHVLVAVNRNKTPMFSGADRVFMLAQCLDGRRGRVKVGLWDGLMAGS